jgi:hypothetical protein
LEAPYLKKNMLWFIKNKVQKPFSIPFITCC